MQTNIRSSSSVFLKCYPVRIFHPRLCASTVRIYKLAKTAAPPNNAPIPMAPVLTGAAGLLVPDAAVLESSVAVADALMELTLALRLLVNEPSSPLSELLTEPVAVANTEDKLLARLAASEVRLATSEDNSDRCDEMWSPTEAVLVMECSEVKSLTTEPAAEVAPATAEDACDSSEEITSEAVWRMPPGSLVEAVAVPSKSWAWKIGVPNVSVCLCLRLCNALFVPSGLSRIPTDLDTRQ